MNSKRQFLIAILWFSLNLVKSDDVSPSILGFNFYYNGGLDFYNLTTLPSLTSNPNFDPSKTTVFYFHGITQSNATERYIIVKDAYLANANYNFVAFNISITSKYHFMHVANIGLQVASSLMNLLNAGLTNYELVGYSLGAQTSGYVGRNIKSLSGGSFSVPRLVALEPAQNLLILKDVNRNDADFVMTVHTTWVISSVFSWGHAAFWMNEGVQRFCLTGIILDPQCNHSVVQLFWAEAVRNGTSTVFPTQPQCKILDIFRRNCITEYMNTKTSASARGLFNVKTNRQSPYSL